MGRGKGRCPLALAESETPRGAARGREWGTWQVYGQGSDGAINGDLRVLGKGKPLDRWVRRTKACRGPLPQAVWPCGCGRPPVWTLPTDTENVPRTCLQCTGRGRIWAQWDHGKNSDGLSEVRAQAWLGGLLAQSPRTSSGLSQPWGLCDNQIWGSPLSSPPAPSC